MTELVARLALSVQLQIEQGMLSFISATTVFGSPIDVNLSELAIECFSRLMKTALFY